MRLFVAVWPSPEARDHLRRSLPSSGRLVVVERWHITLCFLGEVPDEALPGVEQALDSVPTHRPITLRLAGARSFGRRVLAAGVEGPLFGLHRDIVAALDADTRPLKPHLTVTYHPNPEVAQALEGYRGPSWTVPEFSLVRSLNGYHRLRSWPLTGPS